jgi:hypothetical protein
MALCITGMHRSGTSMVTRLLNLCGLHLGQERKLLRPHSTNPEGFWENRRFIKVNNGLLRELGGTWDSPPPAPADWEDLPCLKRLRDDAVRLLRQFRRQEPWGWKDPRNCLTLPFWRRLVPGLRVLHCVRNPLAVARSLHLRDGLPSEASFDLWLTYNRRLLAAVPASERVVTHYDRYFHDPCGELARVLRLVGIQATNRKVTEASASIHPSLSHHQVTLDELIQAGGSPELIACYVELCAEAGFDQTQLCRPVQQERIATLPTRH